MATRGKIRGDVTRYNELGRYVQDERGDRSLAEIARRGGLDASRLGRWLREDAPKITPPDVLQGIADGLGRPLVVLQTIAMRQAHMSIKTPTMNDEQLHVVDAMARVPENFQRSIRDQVLRQVDELAHHFDLEHDVAR